MKHASANYRNRSAAWKGKALATLLAVSLAATPMAAFATDGESAAAAAIAETEAAAPSAPEKQPEAAGENETLTTSVTVYYCEMVYYDDPSFNDPTGFRLLGSHTFDGVKVGEEINLWEYAKDIPDFVHFDGWAVNPIASANPEENLVQMNYFRTKSPSSVNYYLVTDGAETPEDAPIDPSMGEVDGESVAFWKMGSYEVESLAWVRRSAATPAPYRSRGLRTWMPTRPLLRLTPCPRATRSTCSMRPIRLISPTTRPRLRPTRSPLRSPMATSRARTPTAPRRLRGMSRGILPETSARLFPRSMGQPHPTPATRMLPMLKRPRMRPDLNRMRPRW